MNGNEIKNLRMKQLAVTNVILLSCLILFYLMIFFSMNIAHILLVLGILCFIHAGVRMKKGGSTKSIIPIYEKVAIYEKEKLGDEWYKQSKLKNIVYLIIGCIAFLQSYMNWNSTVNFLRPDMIGMFVGITILLLITANVSLLIHNRKIDYSSVKELKGYTWKSVLVAIVLGIVLAIVFFTFIFSYVISNII